MNRDFSLIDANIHRAREGLRVAEDICRFVLRDAVLMQRVRDLRHKLVILESVFGVSSLLGGRVAEDLGSKATLGSEYNKYSLWGILRANFNRATEAIRVLEEFVKIYFPTRAEKVEEMRYAIYKLEFDLLSSTKHYWLNLYFEAGITYVISESVDELVWLTNHGAKVLQLRDKMSSKQEVYKKARYLCEFIKDYEEKNSIEGKVLLFVDDYVEVAEVLPVAGVHIGQQDGEVQVARRRLGAKKIIGRSNHSLEQIKKSVRDGADYVAIGPVWSTPTKEGRPSVGLEVVKQVSEQIFLPWLAIGGINKENSQEVYEAGARNIAVVRAAKDFF